MTASSPSTTNARQISGAHGEAAQAQAAAGWDHGDAQDMLSHPTAPPPGYQVIEITITDHSPAAGQWERLPDRLGVDPGQHAESAAILAEVRRVVDAELTAHQRRTFVAVMVDGIPLDALAARLSLQRNAIYKVIFDARRKIRWALVANGYLEDPGLEQ